MGGEVVVVGVWSPGKLRSEPGRLSRVLARHGARAHVVRLAVSDVDIDVGAPKQVALLAQRVSLAIEFPCPSCRKAYGERLQHPAMEHTYVCMQHAMSVCHMINYDLRLQYHRAV